MHKLTVVPASALFLITAAAVNPALAAQCSRDIISSECTEEDPYIPQPGTESNMVEATDSILEQGTADPALLNAIQQIQQLPSDQQGEAYRSLAFDELGMFHDMTGKLNRINLQLTSERLSVIRDYTRARHTQKRDAGSGAIYGELLARDEDARPGAPGYNRLSTYVRLDYDLGKANRTQYQEGYDYDGYGIGLGLDYLFADSMIIGAAVHSQSMKFKYDSPNTEADHTALHGSLYYSYFRNLWHLDAMATMTSGSTDFSRQVGIPGQVLAKGEAKDVKNSMLTLSLTGGYFLDYDDWAFELEGGVLHATNKVDGFQESAVEGDEAVLSKVEDFDFKSTQVMLGFTTSYPYHFAQTSIYPYLGSYLHTELRGSQRVNTSFIGDPAGTVVPIFSNDKDSLYGRFNLGVGTEISRTWRGFINVATFVGLNDMQATLFSLGLSADF